MVKIQSYVDVITNSSTSIYQIANNRDGLENFINKVLEIGGSPYMCNDLFEITIDKSELFEQYYDNYLCDKLTDEECDIIQNLDGQAFLDYLNTLLKEVYSDDNDFLSIDEWVESKDSCWDGPIYYNTLYDIKLADNASMSNDDFKDLHEINYLFTNEAESC